MVAWIASLWFVVGGVLGARHEARAAHFIDRHGIAFHGSRMVGEHTQNHSDVHSRDATPDHDACGIAAALHHSALLFGADVTMHPSATFALVARSRAHARARSEDIFRIAPKTSPPTTTA